MALLANWQKKLNRWGQKFLSLFRNLGRDCFVLHFLQRKTNIRQKRRISYMSDETSKVTYPLYSKNTFAYGSGNFFATMNPLMQNTFIAFFFSTILLFDSIAVGGMLTVARVINMIAVPCIGILMQKSNPKMGRIRSG
jgi:hypothetical protein